MFGKTRYRRRRGVIDKTKPTRATIAERRRPKPDGQCGYLRVDSVDQRDLDGIKRLYRINIVDAVAHGQPAMAGHRG